MEKYTEYWPKFYTATILEWKPLLSQNKYKHKIIESLQFMVANKKIIVYSFVIMSNHIHLIWQAFPNSTPQKVQASFMKFTAQQIKFDLLKNHPLILKEFRVNAADREYQIWERNPLSIDLYTNYAFMQKLEYIHWNPLKAGLCITPEDYYFSSAKFYTTGIDEFDILTHCGSFGRW